MAFESLSEKLQAIVKKISGQAKLSEANMEEMLKEIRVALLEADVNYRVVKEFVDDVKQKALGAKVIEKVSPGQMIVKIVNDELVSLLGAYLLKNKYKKKVLLVAGDIYRPAAIDQLETLAKQIEVDCYIDRSGTKPPEISKASYSKALKERYDVVIIDTAGRLQINEELMVELQDIQKDVPVKETLLLVDALSGQDAINVANAFNQKVKLTGLIMSKLDSDARGGSALSIKKMTGVPIKFAGVGEKVTDLEVFHPDRMANRILGMGDIVSFVEKAQESIDQEKAMKTTKKIMSGNFGLDDMLALIHQIKRMGPLGKIIKMLPGMPKISDEQISKGESAENMMETIINSMTINERKHPEIIKASRKTRIANGSGTTPQDVNKVLRSYEQMKLAVKNISPFMKKALANQNKK